MKIEINHISNKSRYYEELYGVLSAYDKFIKNPHAKNLTHHKRNMICIAIIAIGTIITFCVSSTSSSIRIKGLSIGAYLVYSCMLVLVIMWNIMYKKRFKEIWKTETNGFLTIDNEKIELINNVTGVTASTKWNSIVQILFLKNVIIFMPKNHTTNPVLSVPIDFENDIIEALKKYNKSELIVYN